MSLTMEPIFRVGGKTKRKKTYAHVPKNLNMWIFTWQTGECLCRLIAIEGALLVPDQAFI
jgi:hypothetical protein